MSTTAKPKVPKLRFRGFTDEWQEKKLGDIAKFSKGAGIAKEDIVADGKTEAIRYGELYTTYGEVISEVKSKTNLNPRSLVLSKKNDVIIPASGETHIDIATAACVLKDGVALSGDINIIRTENDGVFLAYSLNGIKKYEIARFGQGVSVVHLYSYNLRQLVLSLPERKEQTKIAEFLVAIDNKIYALQKKERLLRKYKKGVTRAIFSQEISFKGSKNQWREAMLREVLVKNSQKNKLQENKYVESVSNTKGLTRQDEYFDGRSIASKDLSNYYVIKQGTFAYNPSRINVGSLAYKEDKKIAVVSPLYISFTAKSDYLDDIFLLNWFESLEFKKQMHSSFEGSVRNTLSYEALSLIKIHFPTLDEQRKVASFLTVLDGKIELVKGQLQQAEQFKKTLLLQMFV